MYVTLLLQQYDNIKHSTDKALHKNTALTELYAHNHKAQSRHVTTINEVMFIRKMLKSSSIKHHTQTALTNNT